MTHVLMVCTGNMCRSPLAEAMLRAEFERLGAAGFTVSSAGTGAWDGNPASESALLIGLEHGLDLSEHKARHLTREIVDQVDIVFAMERSHAKRAERLGEKDRVFLLGEYAGRRKSKAEVADPYGAGLETYRRTFDQLQEFISAAADRLTKEYDD